MTFPSYQRQAPTMLTVAGAEREYKWYGDRLEVDFTDMYSAPVEMSYQFLRSMVDHFGSEQIDTDDFNEGGCETCDYGSRYGFVLRITAPTKNLPPKVNP